MRAQPVSLLIGAAAVSAFLALSGGCARAHAKASPDMPPLDVPAAPPRDVAPAGMEAPTPVPLPDEPARHTPERQRPQPRPETPRPEPPKPDTKPDTPPEPTKPPDEAARPPSLQITPPGNEGEVEHTIRATMGRATTDLNRIDYRTLTVEARRQYDMAKSYVRRADRALQDHNLMFAKELADKAADLAVQLAPKK
jgi:hypothetical protein